MATFLNVVGLSIAFAAFIVIVMQVKYEYGFDRFHTNSERIFRVDLPANSGGGVFDVILPRPLVETVLQSSPHIEAGTLVNPFNSQVYFSVMDHGEKRGFKEQIVTAHAEVTKVFSFRIIQGEEHCLHDPEKVLIPQSLAEKIFGKESAVGRHLLMEEPVWTKEKTELVVGAVYKDFPGNSQLGNVIYTAIDPAFAMDNWQASNFLCFLLLDTPESALLVEETFNRNFDFTKIGKEEAQIQLTPLHDVYFESAHRDQRILRGGNQESILLLLGVGLLVIIIAAINFTNFSTALAPGRVKSINTQKVLGSSDKVLRMSLIIEAVLISFFSWFLAILLLGFLRQTHLFTFTEAGIDLVNNIPLLAGTALLSLVIGLLAGLYPARYMTSFSPALVLKGNFGLTPKGRQFRTVLIGFQFTVSVVLIIASSFVHIQRKFMQEFQVGFDKDQIAVVELSGSLYVEHRETLANKWKSYPGVEDVTFSSEKVGGQDTYSTSGIDMNDITIPYYSIAVSPNFFSVMGIPIVEGRDLSLADEKSSGMPMILNKQMRDKYGLELGLMDFRFFMGNIIGFSEDPKLTSLRLQDANYVFMTGVPYPLQISYVRLSAGTDHFAAVDHIRKSVAEVDPAYPVHIEFYDQIFNQLYQKEDKLSRIISLFSALAILISIVGVFGLVMFETQYRKKEIGIRKVMGAGIRDILVMFNKIYLHMICLCFVVAAPIAYVCIRKWLENFAFKTPIYWWVFVMAFILVATITMLTVTFQNWKAASANPVKSLKSE